MKLVIRHALVAAILAGSWTIHRAAQAQAPAVEPLHFHHVHLNSVDPAKSAAFYPKAFPLSTTTTTYNGFEAVKSGNIFLLFTKVAQKAKNDVTGPQTSVWHYGWSTPNSREYSQRYRAQGIEILQLWDAADGKLVDLSSDALPGTPTQEQILELRAKGVEPTKQHGFQFIRDLDGSMIENSSSPASNAERFGHMHMYHEYPICAVEWYVKHLGAKVRPARDEAASAPAAGGDCRKPYGPTTWPSPFKTGFVRDPNGAVLFDDIAVTIRPWPGGGLAGTRGTVVDHWAVSTADLSATVARLKGEGVKFLEEIHPWGKSRAAMIEGPDRIAIELVEVK